jgi:hypothetical protein
MRRAAASIKIVFADLPPNVRAVLLDSEHVLLTTHERWPTASRIAAITCLLAAMHEAAHPVMLL